MTVPLFWDTRYIYISFFSFKYRYQRNICIHILREYFIPDHLVPFLYVLCLRSDGQEAYCMWGCKTRIAPTYCLWLWLCNVWKKKRFDTGINLIFAEINNSLNRTKQTSTWHAIQNTQTRSHTYKHTYAHTQAYIHKHSHTQTHTYCFK